MSVQPFYDRRHGDVCIVTPKTRQTGAMAALFGAEEVLPVQGTHLRILFDAEGGTLYKHGGDRVLEWQAKQEAKGTPFDLARIDIPLGAASPEVLAVVNEILARSRCGRDLVARLSALAPSEDSAPRRG